MKTGSDLRCAVRELVAETISAGVVGEDEDLLMAGLLDSVTLVQLILQLEQSFGVRIELNDLEIDDLRSVRSIAALLTKLHATGLADDTECAHAISGMS